MNTRTFSDLGGPPVPWLLVFDLDGTLIDSSLDLCNAVNAALAHVDRSALSRSLISSFIGDGAAVLLRRALETSFPLGKPELVREVNDGDFAQAFGHFLKYYRQHKLDTTRAYKGVLAALRVIRLRRPELPMAVLTNKPVNPSREICAALNLAPFFFANYGGDSFQSKKPDPEGIRALVSEARAAPALQNLPAEQLSPEGVVMIGDSDVDVFTARNCGARSLGCRYGLAPEALELAQPDLFVDGPEQWPDALSL